MRSIAPESLKPVGAIDGIHGGLGQANRATTGCRPVSTSVGCCAPGGRLLRSKRLVRL